MRYLIPLGIFLVLVAFLAVGLRLGDRGFPTTLLRFREDPEQATLQFELSRHMV